MNIGFIISFLISIIVILIIVILINYKPKNVKEINIEVIKNFESFIVIQEFYSKKSYDIIYRDKILIYSLESMKPNKNVIERFTKDYINLTLKFLGPRFINDFIYFYGDRRSFYFNLTEYFQTRLEDDEVRKTATDNLINDNNNDDV